MSRKRCERNREKNKPDYQVCLLTFGEVTGAMPENCANHAHVGREKADSMRAENELIFLDQWLSRAVDFDENGKPLSASKGSTPCHITSRESQLNGMAAIEPRHPAVIAAQRKIKAWPYTGDHKAIRVGVRI